MLKQLNFVYGTMYGLPGYYLVMDNLPVLFLASLCVHKYSLPTEGGPAASLASCLICTLGCKCSL